MPVVSVEASVERVTVYARGARVRRVTAIPAPLPTCVRIVGLPLGVIDDTVHVEVGGPAIATAVRVDVDAPAHDEADREEPAELAASRRRVAHADAEIERLEATLEMLHGASVVELDVREGEPAAFGAVLAARRALAALRGSRELALRHQLAAVRREAEDARRAHGAAADRDIRTGTARPPKAHELRKYVEIDLTATAASEIVVHLEYVVEAARWAPSYVARIDGDRVGFEIRAVVAQATGEDWTAVPLVLSTAEPTRFAPLPELAPQKIGRRQAESAKSGFRAPPAGADTLYADYDRVLRPKRTPPGEARPFTGRSEGEDSTYVGVRPGGPPPPQAASPRAAAAFAAEVWDEESSRGKEAFSTPAAGSPMPDLGGGASLPRSLAAKTVGGVIRPELDEQMRLQRARPRREIPPEVPAESRPAASAPRLDYSNLVMAPPSSPLRGRLAPAPDLRQASVIATELAAALAKLTMLPLPSGCRTEWTHAYDYAFTTDGAVDIAADDAWHSIAVSAKPSSVRLWHVAVPREQPDVFRVGALTNPFAGPLLPGPIDIYDRGRFLITSEVDYTPPGGTLEVGLGVDPAVKIARNTEYREESAGMLRGALRLHHAVSIEVENLSTRAIEIEVRERIPVVREGDDDVEVIAGKIDPPWERWTPDPRAPRDQRLRGGYRWKLAIPAGAKRTLRAGYEIKIAGKHELVGGNRRES